ncbi:MlaD family protein [Leptolyngbya sp. AN02str]|uniref:MlaD family protein n=1 Tax=Leptolyngbya sp. AN02str TaxID=3423363 RepID=UPI003D316F70
MRSRTLREGSVGLLILAGVGLFIGLVLWLRGLNFSRSYKFSIELSDAGGVQVGAPVRYRGVPVGFVTAVSPGYQAAEVEVEISPADTIIPRNAILYPNQSGLIGESGIDILPPNGVPTPVSTNPLAEDCNSAVIICDGDRVQGEEGVTFTELIRATLQITDVLTNTDLLDNINTLTRNTAEAATGVTQLTSEVTDLTRSVRGEVQVLLGSANSTTLAVGQAANQLSFTSAEVNRLLASNEGALVTTLDNVSQASGDIRLIVNRLMPLVDDQGAVSNLQALSLSANSAASNAAQAAASLRNLTDALGSSENVLLLQETLDSARATFQNAQKITADLDELTGDPAVRDSIRELIHGLGNLVSSTQQLQEQTAVAEALVPTAEALRSAAPSASAMPAPISVPSVAARTPQPTGQTPPTDTSDIKAEPKFSQPKAD